MATKKPAARLSPAQTSVMKVAGRTVSSTAGVDPRLTGSYRPGLGSAAVAARNYTSAGGSDPSILSRLSAIANQGVNPKPASAAAAPPVSASGRSDAPLVGDEQYNLEVGNYEKGRSTALGGLTRERNDALATYGYTGTFDAAGNLVDRQFDPNNPFSRAALLKRTYDQSSRGNVNRMAARGQLNAGSFQNLKNNTDFGYMQGEDANQKSLNALIGSLIGRQQTVNTEFDSKIIGARGSLLSRALGGLS